MAILSTVISAYAFDFESGGFYFNVLSEQDKTVEVTSGDTPYSGNIEIPRQATNNGITYTVTIVGDHAFAECSSLTSVIIPNSVLEIRRGAFYACNALTSITIPNSVMAILDGAFSDCISLESLTLPDGIDTIASELFYGCISLSSITIPDSVEMIVKYAFEGCSSLTFISIPASVSFIGDSVFNRCESLEAIIVDPENQYYSSFEGVLYNKDKSTLLACPGAKTNVIIPNSVTRIECAFEYCNRLRSVTIPNSVTYIVSDAFYECNSLSTIYNLCETPIECSTDFSNVVFENAILYIPMGTLTEYKNVFPWQNFEHIVETNFSGVEEIGSDMSDVRVSVNNGVLTVNGIASGEEFVIYDMCGCTVYSGNDTVISPLPSGFYILKAGSKTVKFAI